MTECTSPESASTPMCAFIPKCHWLPFLVWCISGSRSPSLFLVELGAAMMVASTMVPVLSIRPCWASPALMAASTCGASWCFSSRWRKRRMVVSSGMRAAPSRPAKRRYSGRSCSSSSMAGSLRFHHSCKQWMRSMVSMGNGGRPPRAWCGPLANGAMRATSVAQGTTWFISSRKTSLRVFLGSGSRPRVY